MPDQETKPRRILFLEDEGILTMVFGPVLESLRLGEVVVVHSLGEAERELERAAFDIAVLDLNIAGATSLPIAERVVRAGGRVVLATGQARNTIDTSGLACRILLKPYEEGALRKAVLDAYEELEGTPSRASGPEGPLEVVSAL